MTYSFQVWNGTQWETKFITTVEAQVQKIKEELEMGGMTVIVVGDGYMPKRPTNLDDNIVKALLES